MPGSLYHLNLTPFWQDERQRKYPGSLSLTTFKNVISRVRLPESAFCPKNVKQFLKLGGGGGEIAASPSPRPVRQCSKQRSSCVVTGFFEAFLDRCVEFICNKRHHELPEVVDTKSSHPNMIFIEEPRKRKDCRASQNSYNKTIYVFLLL